MTKLLASQEDFAALRGVVFDPTDLAALIALEGASDSVRTYTGQDFEAVFGDVKTLDGTGGESLLLPQKAAIHQVTEVAMIATDGTPTILTPVSQWRLGEAGIIWRIAGPWFAGDWWSWYGWPKGRQNIRVTYDHGYTLPDQVGTAPVLPSDIQGVVLQAAARMMLMGTTGGQGITQESIGTYSVTYGHTTSLATSTGLNGLEQASLDHYRVDGVA